MQVEQHNCNIDVLSIKKGTNEIISQKAISIHKHKVERIFRVLSKNDKNWSKDTVFGPGYFNNKTNFLLGNENSVVILDKDMKMLDAPDNNIDNIMNKDDLFMIYPIPCFNMLQNEEIVYNDIYNIKDVKITLDRDLGIKFGQFLATNGDEKLIHKNKNFLKLVIGKKNGLSLNKNFIIYKK